MTTYTLNYFKGASNNWICGLNEAEAKRMTNKHEKEGFTVSLEAETPYPKQKTIDLITLRG